MHIEELHPFLDKRRGPHRGTPVRVVRETKLETRDRICEAFVIEAVIRSVSAIVKQETVTYRFELDTSLPFDSEGRTIAFIEGDPALPSAGFVAQLQNGSGRPDGRVQVGITFA